ncbi:hypothetical protein M378DRAFT_173727 [Amanita muscaria Koide BX008]|uniref:Uncharacterized protein n=1 Tax=Amanita muscaria (strain Koide BX008) TaxID=946122 RepID=A0A0C2WFC0_AMAMK|nr:hypothetical protein M378DRAFT_173727 [Amanita muscaria Koide BX008]
MIESFSPQSTSSSAVEICGSTTMGSARPRPRADQLGLGGLEALMDRCSDNGDGYVEYVGSGMVLIKVVNNSRFRPRIRSLFWISMITASSSSTSTTPATAIPTPNSREPILTTTWDTPPRADPRYTDGRYYMMDEQLPR